MSGQSWLAVAVVIGMAIMGVSDAVIAALWRRVYRIDFRFPWAALIGNLATYGIAALFIILELANP